MAAVMLSARKTPYQNMGECSGVKLKGAAGMSVIGSPSLARGVGGGSRGPAPRVRNGCVFDHFPVIAVAFVVVVGCIVLCCLLSLLRVHFVCVRV